MDLHFPQILLESLHCAAFDSPLALEHLQDFIYYAYILFYTGLLEDPTLGLLNLDGWKHWGILLGIGWQ